MESNAIYTTSDAGLNRFFGKIYGLVGMGVGLSAVISYLMLGPFSHLFVNILMNYSWVYTAAIFVELALVFLASLFSFEWFYIKFYHCPIHAGYCFSSLH